MLTALARPLQYTTVCLGFGRSLLHIYLTRQLSHNLSPMTVQRPGGTSDQRQSGPRQSCLSCYTTNIGRRQSCAVRSHTCAATSRQRWHCCSFDLLLHFEISQSYRCRLRKEVLTNCA